MRGRPWSSRASRMLLGPSSGLHLRQRSACVRTHASVCVLLEGPLFRRLRQGSDASFLKTTPLYPSKAPGALQQANYHGDTNLLS